MFASLIVSILFLVPQWSFFISGAGPNADIIPLMYSKEQSGKTEVKRRDDNAHFSAGITRSQLYKLHSLSEPHTCNV